MRFLVLFLSVLVLMPAQLLALSCVRPSAVRSFQEAQASVDSYVVVKGYLNFNAKDMPTPETINPAPVAARLRGSALGAGGFALPFDQQVTLSLACFGPWCATAPARTEVLAFLRRAEAGYVLDLNPCGGNLFAQPSPEMLREVAACGRGETCESADLRRIAP
ncbi:MAG: hypothetical protein ACSHWZ_10920 [Sulfitobacter sp.]